MFTEEMAPLSLLTYSRHDGLLCFAVIQETSALRGLPSNIIRLLDLLLYHSSPLAYAPLHTKQENTGVPAKTEE